MLRPAAAAACRDPENQLLLSVASVWGIQIKSQLGKLRLGLPFEELQRTQQHIHGLVPVPVNLSHAFALRDLPTHDNDPFDRMLMTQARVENAVLVTADAQIGLYRDNVTLLW